MSHVSVIFETYIRYGMTDCTYSKSILQTFCKFHDSDNLKMLQFENISVYLKMLQTIFLFNLKSNMFGCCSSLSERGILKRFFGNKYKSPWYFSHLSPQSSVLSKFIYQYILFCWRNGALMVYLYQVTRNISCASVAQVKIENTVFMLQ